MSLSESDAVKYGQIPLFNGKAALQPTGTELKEFKLNITYSVDFCDPDAEIAALKKSMHDREVLPYITGAGSILGKYVITSIETTFQRAAPDGSTEMANINVNLLESPGGEDPQPVGKALASQEPVTELPAEPVPTPAAEITEDLGEAKTKVSAIKNAINKIKNKTTEFKRGVREVRQLASDAQRLYTSAKTKVDNTVKIIKRASELPTSLDECIKYAENLAKLDNVADISVLEMNAGQLSGSADKVTARAAPVVGFSATKEGGS